jgi:hypothetical protein
MEAAISTRVEVRALRSGYGAGDQRRDEIDQDKNDQELHAQRTALPQCLHQPVPRRLRQRCEQNHPSCPFAR